MNRKWLGFSVMAPVLTAFALWLAQGCAQKLPSLASVAIPPTPTPQTSWFFETNTNIGAGNGNWNDTGLNVYAGTPVTGVVSWSQPGYNGSVGCLSDNLTFSGSAQSDTLQYTPLSPLNFTALGLNGLSAEIWVDSSLDSAPSVQIYFQSGSGTWEWGNQVSVTPNAWTSIGFIPTWSNNGEDPTKVQSFWITVKSGSGGTLGSGNIKLDNIVLNAGAIIPVATPTVTSLPASPTPTFTPVAADSWYFESSTMGAAGNGIGTAANQSDTWYDNGAGSVSGVISWASPGYNGSAGCLVDFLTFTAQGQTDEIQYSPSSPMNWTSLGIVGMRGEVWVDGSLDTNGSPVVQLFASSGSGTVWEYGGYDNLTGNAWTEAAWVPPFSTSGTDPTQVHEIWFKIVTNTGSSFGSGNIKLDNIELY